MITYLPGDIFSSKAQALVNPVNTVGVMGKGLALEFKKRFPKNYRMYVQACDSGLIGPGRCFVYQHAKGVIINFPTKMHWESPSDLFLIDAGLIHLKKIIKFISIQTLAMPALGCGLGNLNWPDVKKLIELHLGDVPAEIEVYLPC